LYISAAYSIILPMTYDEIRKRLVDGNLRYIGGNPPIGVTDEMRAGLVGGQHPYAVVIGCSDSRVPVEIIFDAVPGELFVIRTAGNTAGPLEIGSIEFAVKELGVHLILVLGHQNCGAIHAALTGGDFSPSMQAFLSEMPSYTPDANSDNPYETYADENIKHTLAKIAANPYISESIAAGTIQMVAAKYSLETGKVTFFD